MSIDIMSFRGYIEKTIDLQLETENLVNMHAMFEALKPAVAKRESAIFGYVVGFLVSNVAQLINTFARREITSEELHEVTSILLRRGLEIRRRIIETST